MSTEDLLSSVSDVSDETEFYTPLPTGYIRGRCKYVVITGTVMSGLGKGIFSSSLAKLMQDKGLKVSPVKLEGYLNVDSGTLNPFRHGEVFVLDDGMECDMDLGTYERMLDQDLTGMNFTTSGQIFTRVLEKERHGDYLGRDVQMIPHVTGEVKMRLRELAVASQADVVFIEIGGTVGDVENAYYIEAVRELAYEEGPGSVCFVALTYVLEPKTLGEQKSKAAQLGIKRLMENGVQPHIIACRAEHPVVDKVRQKIAQYANVPLERVFSMHDCESIYVVPEMLRESGLDFEVIRMLRLDERVNLQHERHAWLSWCDFVERDSNRKYHVRIGITGKYTSLRDSYASIIHALEHSGAALSTKIDIEWIDTSDLNDNNVTEKLAGLNGIIVPGGFGTRGAEGKIACIKYARENNLPYLGICFGFQMAVIEFARNVCGLKNANSTELQKDCQCPVVSILPEQEGIEGLGGNMRLGGKNVEINPETLAHRLFGGATSVRMRFRHRLEVDPQYIDTLTKNGLVFSGKAPGEPIMQILELPNHPYFIGTQAHPCMTSRPLHPQEMFVGLVAAARKINHPDQDLPDGFTAAETINKTIQSSIKAERSNVQPRSRAKNSVR
ncbi:MAG: CTP synthase (glutamine hydrolyzing) [Sedimentisphaerales bacterium]|nr:CTP synthase (glutamine hydrolyzing) [Sedimentisphaerales bacterium]